MDETNNKRKKQRRMKLLLKPNNKMAVFCFKAVDAVRRMLHYILVVLCHSLNRRIIAVVGTTLLTRILHPLGNQMVKVFG
jgi:hypothetical protein